MLQEGDFVVDPAAVAGDRAVYAHHAVARNDQADRIPADGAPHCARGHLHDAATPGKRCGDCAIGGRRAERDFQHFLHHFPPERSEAVDPVRRREVGLVSGKVDVKPAARLAKDLFTRRRGSMQIAFVFLCVRSPIEPEAGQSFAIRGHQHVVKAVGRLVTALTIYTAVRHCGAAVLNCSFDDLELLNDTFQYRAHEESLKT